MDPQQRFCPNPDCPARGQIGQGNLTVHSQEQRRYRCKVCKKPFSERDGTVYFRLQTAPDLVTLVLTLITHGCPVPAITQAFGFQARTVRRWMEKAGGHCEAVHDHRVAQPQDRGHVQADELRVKLQKGVCWVAMALCVPSRLWLGAVESPRRDKALARSLLERVKAAAREGPLLFVTDGWSAYREAAKKAFRTPVRTPPGKGAPPKGRPKLRAWAGRVLGQVVKQREKGQVVSVERRLLEGTEADLLERLRRWGGGKSLNTAYIERLNATFRARLYALVRRTRALARRQALLHAGVYLIGSAYNFCTVHQSLSKEQPCTPAMAAGITDPCWSVRELLEYRVPLPQWQPPKKRGRKSKALLALIERWAT
jgi:transposase-like protein